MSIASWAFFHGRTAITEILWTFFGLVGIILNCNNLHHARKDLQLLGILQLNGILKKIAGSHLRSNFFRVLVNLVVVTVGITAMIQKPVNPAIPVTPTGTVITGGLFVIVILSILNAYSDRRFRHNLMKDDSINDSSKSGEKDVDA